MSSTDSALPAGGQQWTDVITSERPWFHLPLAELWKYRELLWMFIRRDLVAIQKQTVLGPLWFFIQPIVSAMVFTVVFGLIVRVPVGNIPFFLFFYSGIMVWYFISEVFTRTSQTFTANSNVITKIYFPRLIIPLSQMAVGMFTFIVQFAIFLAFYAFYRWQGADIEPSYRVVIIPFLVLQAGLLAMGLGCLVAALTTRFRDLQLAVPAWLQLWMYGSCIMFPRSIVPDNLQWVMTLNPLPAIVEAFRFSILGQGDVEIYQWLISLFLTLVIFAAGIIEFGRAEKTFADTV
jgi:lipopolysaccharide transport system permease protein